MAATRWRNLASSLDGAVACRVLLATAMRSCLGLIALSTLLLAGCGGGDDPIACTGSTCTCEPETTCDLSGTECADQSCSVDCGAGSECTGACGASCSLDCGDGARCEVTVGPSASVTCAAGATCEITCTASCSLSCSPDATCTLQCADGGPQTVEGSASCE